MKYLGLVILMAIGFTSCQEQQKIGFIDNGEVINAYQAKIDLEETYKEKDVVFQKRRDSMIAAYQLELKEAQVKAQRMSQAKLQELSQQIQQKEQILSQKIQSEQQEMQKSFQADIDSVIVKVKGFVQDYGKTNGYTYILGTSENAASVLYGKEENNLSKEITEALNAAYEKK